MKHHLTRQLAAVALIVGLAVGGGGIAFAYFTSSGTGTGSASVGTATDDFTFGTDGPAALFPGADPQAFDVIVTNEGTVPEHVGTVPVKLMTSGTGPSQSVTDESGVPVEGCLSSWFTISSSVTIDRTVAVAASYTLPAAAPGAPTIRLDESGTDQTACAGHSVRFQFGLS